MAVEHILASARWSADQISGIDRQTGWELPILRAGDVVPIRPDEVVWDMWQLADRRGGTVRCGKRSLWFFLAAPRAPDPDARHDVARITLCSHGADGWRDHGAALPPGLSPGSREWSGSTVLDEDGETVAMYFTAAGGAGRPAFEQRLFATTGRLLMRDGEPRLDRWSPPIETVVADERVYARANQAAAVDDRIKGFRDPGYFHDPADGRDYLLFTGSAANSRDVHDGVIGLALHAGDRWRLRPPILSAIGVNSELERPHIVCHAGRYHLFWSTQAKRFSRAASTGVTGLYGMVADSLAGPWRPANGTGLVAGNPHAEPSQAYCWWVTGELDVASFVDHWGLGGTAARPPSGDHFGGAPAPFFKLRIEGDAIRIA